MSASFIQVRSLHVYPLKSAAAVDVSTALVEPEGLAGDRRMMVIDEAGECLTSRRFPALLTLRCVVEGGNVILIAPNRKPCVFSCARLEAAPDVAARIWGAEVRVLDAGAPVAAWLSEFLRHSCRLALKGPRTDRRLLLDPGGVVSFADTAPLLLVGEASLADLNAHLVEPVEMGRFRPNVVVSGTLPFDEDGWRTIRIGEVEFDVAGPCDRCIVTTLDPGSGALREDREPLSTLAKRRRGRDGKPYFGQFLVPRGAGRMFVGDTIEVVSRKKPVDLMEPLETSRPVALARALPRPRAGAINLVCTGVVRETEDMTSFRFRPEDGIPIGYHAGQFMTLRLDIGGSAISRSYTVSSSPSRPGIVSITVKRVTGGVVSNWLHGSIRVGDRIVGTGPHGRFHIAAVGANLKLLMISAGSGITPMISMLRFVADLDLPYDIVFHHSARRLQDLPFMEELAALERQMVGRLRLSWNLTGEEDRKNGRESRYLQGRFDAGMLEGICPNAADRVALCCGPAGFRATVRALHHSFAPNALYLEESFGAEAGTAGIESATASYEIMFRKSGVDVKGEGSGTILQIARRSGIDLPADCEAGICGTCRCRIVSGEWKLAPNCADPECLVLGNDEKRSGYVLACSTQPVGRVVVDI
ncbi:MOSC domain-containing protein [Neorhizobium sp. DT-125]|uniref:MOSC domain-containing protein n=1 Tax=Neorhizobium sp. DT-125 TaxID=3396163 RepID=UPI003F197744